MSKVSDTHTSKIQILSLAPIFFFIFFLLYAVSLKNIIVFESRWFYDIPRVPIRIRNVSSSSTLFWTHWRTWPRVHARAVNPSESEVPAVDLLWSSATGRHVDKLKHWIQKIQLFSSNQNCELSYHSVFSGLIYTEFCQAETNNIHSHARLNALCWFMINVRDFFSSLVWDVSVQKILCILFILVFKLRFKFFSR